jgi:hypothetical protein
LLKFLDQLFKERPRLIGGERLLAHHVEVLAETLHLFLVAATYKLTAKALDEQQVLGWILEIEQDERPQEPGVGTGAKRYDLHRDAGLIAGSKQVLQLASHDRRAADPAVQRFLAKNEDHLRGVPMRKQAPLPLPAHLDNAPGVVVTAVHPEQLEGILLGMQQAWDQERVEDADRRGGGLLAQVEGERGRDHVTELAPPV